MRKIKFVSQRGVKSKRLEKAGCGVAALMMLLQERYSQITNYDDLAKQLRATEKPYSKGHVWYPEEFGAGAWIDDITGWLSRNGIPYHGIFSDYWIQGSREHAKEATTKIVLALLKHSPVMVGVARYGFDVGGHWIVLESFSKGEFLYLDPWLIREKRKRLPWERFVKAWDGTAVALRV